MCLTASEQTGGVVLPPRYCGTARCEPEVGIENFARSLLPRESIIKTLMSDALDQLIERGYKVIVLLAGHNPEVQGRLPRRVVDKRTKKSSAKVQIVQQTDLEKILSTRNIRGSCRYDEEPLKRCACVQNLLTWRT